eukprot:TRINITY_DN380_c0_g1_i2.p1 TRINITY_DN380_c0_g1~~TRINITY_DN380_c0_g1_i2.p1  ORF type:complete len:1306 (+),score=512.63 TRINITY_DN380_c0_g1_i2:726-4643(+)
MHEPDDRKAQLLDYGADPEDYDAEENTDERGFFIGDYEKNKSKFCSNDVTTSKYSLIPGRKFFLVKNILEQFRRHANKYFFIVALLQLIPGLSPTGQYTTLVPLSTVLLVSLFKDSYEDWKRHKRDSTTNWQPATVFRDSEWRSVRWRDVCVGDLMRVAKEHEFPADLVLLYSPADKGICHIETSNLDGETNLKLRKAHVEATSTGSPLPPFDPNNPGGYEGRIACKPPDEDMYKFEGYLERKDATKRTHRARIDVDSILLRGSKLGGSAEEIMGVVVYTGKETKLMKNQKESELKTSQLERNTNKQIFRIFFLELIVCAMLAFALGAKTGDFDAHWYLAPDHVFDKPLLEGLAGFLTFIILLNNMVPISLYVTIEIVKLIQASMISSDINMYYAEADVPAKADTSSLNEELGQVQYVFSDKTGTLTCNIMDFLKFSVGEVSYGTGTTEIGRAAAAREGKKLIDDRPQNAKMVKGFYFYDSRISDVTGAGRDWRWMRQPNSEELSYFFKVLAVCHTVVAEKASGGGEIKYQAQSPDENCLVTGAKYLGVEFIERTADTIKLRVKRSKGDDDTEVWSLLHILEFDSDRKRMSVVVRDPGGRLLLLCKGADTVIYERLRKAPSPQEQSIQEKSREYLTKYAKDGLRTLCIAQSVIDEKDYQSWAPKYKKATENIGNRERMIAEAADDIEKDLELLGTTAIEDKLQKGVPATIELLRSAGIKVWVLTGDKQETAINIGFACALLNNEMGLFKFNDTVTESNITQTLQNFARDADSVRRDYGQELGMVVQGQTLKLILGDMNGTTNHLQNAGHFLSIAEHCGVVICCRVTPGQKAQVVQLVKRNLDQVTLAIGDGANDVSMIKEAHVGVGISGLEGLQAANSADYAIGQFRFLARLLMVHGRWSYRRNSKLILYSFYKNICLYLTQGWYCFFNSFTGQSLYDSWSLTLYNVAFTAVPIVALAIFDRDIEPKRLIGDENCPGTEQFPELYEDGRKGKLFNTKVFWCFTLNAALHSALCLFIPVFAMYEMSDPDTGWAFGLDSQGLTGYTAVILVVTAKCALESSSWTWVNIFVVFGSVGLWFAFLFIYCNFDLSRWLSDQKWYKTHLVLGKPIVWLVVALVLAVALLRDVSWKCYKRNFEPNLSHIIQIWEKKANNGEVADFDRHVLKTEAPKLFPRHMVKNYKKKDDRPQKVEAEPDPRAKERQQLEYLANMNMSAQWALQHANPTHRSSILGASVGSPASLTGSPLNDRNNGSILGGHGSHAAPSQPLKPAPNNDSAINASAFDYDPLRATGQWASPLGGSYQPGPGL